MSHDIRAPLNAIIGYTTLAKENCSGHETDEDDVLEMSRIESGRMELTRLRENRPPQSVRSRIPALAWPLQKISWI